MTALLLLLLFASALRWSNYSGDSESTGSASSTDDNYFRRLGPSSTYGQDRQSVRLRVGLGDEGSIRVQPQGRGDPAAAAAAAAAAALDVVPDGSDAARCAVELRPCRSCWISLTATIRRFDDTEVGDGEEDERMTDNNASNGSKSSTVTCRLWSVWILGLPARRYASAVLAVIRYDAIQYEMLF